MYANRGNYLVYEVRQSTDMGLPDDEHSGVDSTSVDRLTVEQIEAMVISHYPMGEKVCRIERKTIERLRARMRERLIEENK